jgi:hypothetical protein
LQECLARREFGADEKNSVVELFGGPPVRCSFCGSSAVRRWDHLVPVMKGGEAVPGNLVPACARCDDSKQDFPFEEWMTGDTPASPKSRETDRLPQRVALLKAYVRRFDYVLRPLEDRLSDDELADLLTIRSDLAALRERIDSLIARYRERPGS